MIKVDHEINSGVAVIVLRRAEECIAAIGSNYEQLL
jgi:hypothetical protein